MSKKNPPVVCFSCARTIEWSDILKASATQNVRESSTPGKALCEELNVKKLCCRSRMFNHRVSDLLHRVKKNEENKNAFMNSDLSSDSKPGKFSKVYPDI